jgi:hypothetical protein
MKVYNREGISLKECYDNLMFLKDMRNQIPHDFKMSSDLKKADKLLVEEIKYWEKAISSRDRSNNPS